MSKPRLIAFYLPQFYPTPENDEWWEPGFTEWTNVVRAKPLFPGHDQPKIPRDLGFYDLRVPETREKQVQLAREAGIEGFCYWHYWFGNGKRLLDQVFREVVETGKPDFPFCLCWANHSWYKKVWDPSKGKDKLLIEQTYPGKQDYIDHFNAMLPAFKDSRYMKVNGKLIFGVFASLDVPDVQLFKETWNRLALENGLGGFYFFALTGTNNNAIKALNMGYDKALVEYVQRQNIIDNKLEFWFWKIVRKFTNLPKYITYNHYMKAVINGFDGFDDSTNILPCIVPNFDHSPRSKNRGAILLNSTPHKYEKLLDCVFSKVSDREHEENVVFVKAWNEWGEGNYLEPDQTFGKGYIEATKLALEKIK